MLDANARYIGKGVKFFVGGYVSEGSELVKIGAKAGQPYLCKMMDNSNGNPRFSIKVNGKVHVVKYKCDYSFLTYQGVPNGNGFICNKSKSACEKLIGGFNNTYWKRRAVQK
ncbi:MAG: hypothetical protein GY738_21840 [Pseudoalteromonas sp.]|nr:hypothetical protein [Pseudoalteromonas sp.]